MRDPRVLLCTVSVGALVAAGCPRPERGDPIGTPCNPETLCEDLCLLDLPDGMCSMDCSEDDCPDGYVCGDISGGRYCLAACTDDAGCREGMICVVGECRLAMGFDATCEEGEDCREGVCYDGACNRECRGGAECPAELSCVDVGEGPRCVAHEWPTGDGTFGDSCTFADCAADYLCMARTEDPGDDPDAYCTRSCLTDLECPAAMACRRTQAWGEDEVIMRCVPRGFCESCAYDAQCGTSADLCVSNDPDRGEGRYCSTACDPERERSTCPTDSRCSEALWCGADRSWVSDCGGCSEPGSCGTAEGGPRYQCFKDFGACAGTGSDYCSPCFVDADCPEGGHCAYDPYARNSFCTEPCGEGHECPYEHACFNVTGLDEPVCMPRSGSCALPSGGLTTCYGCDDWRDCVSGQCLPMDLSNPYSPQVCWEDCSGGPSECPAYTECYSLSDGTNNFNLCGPQRGMRCGTVQICLEQCPEGPSSCSPDAPSSCL